MLALSMLMYAISAAHWALGIPFIKVLEAGHLIEVVMIDFTLLYLPSVNVSVLGLACKAVS